MCGGLEPVVCFYGLLLFCFYEFFIYDAALQKSVSSLRCGDIRE